MELQFLTLDVFTNTPYEGNPLALVLVPPPLSQVLTTVQKQKIAKEFNLSETAFLHLHDETTGGSVDNSGNLDFVLDIFLTTAEIPFAGHPTVGAAWYVLNKILDGISETATLITKSGAISISKDGNSNTVLASIAHNLHVHEKKITAMSGSERYWHVDGAISDKEKNAPFVSIVKGMTFQLVRLDTDEQLAKCAPNNQIISCKDLLDQDWNVGFVGKEYFVLPSPQQLVSSGVIDIHCRMMESAWEDPATGSAACALTGHIVISGLCGQRVNEKVRFRLVQGVEMGRKSVIHVEVEVGETGEVQAIRLAGEAVKVMEGRITI